MRALIKDFQRRYPGVKCDFVPRGSNTAPDELANKKAAIGVMSRRMSPEEKAAVSRSRGQNVIEITLATDGILVLVNANNPITQITLPQLDAIYGTDRLAGYVGRVSIWKDLGVQGELANKAISAYGILELRHGTVETFRRIVLKYGNLNKNIHEIEFPEKEIGKLVADDPVGISYTMYHLPFPGAKTLSVSAKAGAPFVEAKMSTISDGTYPLTRSLYAYIVGVGDPLANEFLAFAISREGQQIIADNEACPVSPAIANRQLDLLKPGPTTRPAALTPAPAAK